MPCDPAHRDALLSQATVLLLRVGTLRRHLGRREDLPPEAAAWLETSLEALMHSVHDLTRLAAEEGAPGPAPVCDAIPTTPLERPACLSRP